MINIIFKSVFLFFTYKTIQNKNHIFYLIAAVMTFDILIMSFGISDIMLSLGSITLKYDDMLCVVMVLKLFIQRNKKIKISPFYIIFMIYVALIILSLIRGVGIAGLNSTVIGNLRKYMGYIIPILYFYLMDYDFILLKDKLLRICNYQAFFVLLFCLYSWLMYFSMGVEGIGFGLRSVTSSVALSLGVFTLWNIYDELIVNENNYISIASLWKLLTIVILQHNSTWVAVGVGLLLILYLKSSRSIKGILTLTIQIVSIVIFATGFLYVSGNSFLITGMESTLNKFNDLDSGTIGHRRERWATLLGSLNIVEKLIGQSFAKGTETGTINFSAHSAYVAAILKSGYTGFVFLLLSIYLLIVKLFYKKKYNLLILIISIVIYWYAYEPDFIIGTIIGCIANTSNIGKSWKALVRKPISISN